MPRKAKDTVTADLFELPPEPSIYAVNIPLKGLFLHNEELHMQVQPSKWMMNSTLIYENTMKGNIFAINMETNRIVMLKPETPVIHVKDVSIYELNVKE